MTEVKTKKIIFKRKGHEDEVWELDMENDKGSADLDGVKYEFKISETFPIYATTPIMFKKEDAKT